MKPLPLILLALYLLGCKSPDSRTVIVGGVPMTIGQIREQNRENAKALTPGSAKVGVFTNRPPGPPIPFVAKAMLVVWECAGTNGEVFLVERSMTPGGPRTILASNLVEKSFPFIADGPMGFFHVSAELP
jgi:hypothetical protein